MNKNIAELFGFEGEEFTLSEAFYTNISHPVLTIHIVENGAKYIKNYFDDEAIQKLNVLENNNFSVKTRK